MLWVIELMAEDRNSQWIPTVGVGRSRKAGELELARWRRRLPKDSLRLKEYRRVEE